MRASGDVGRMHAMEKARVDGQAAWAEARSSDEGRTRAVELANSDAQAALAEARSREPVLASLRDSDEE